MLRLDTIYQFSDIFFGALRVLSDYRFNMVQLYQHTLFLEADIKHFSTFYGLHFSQRFCSELNKFSDGMVISTPTIYLYWVNFSCEFLCRDTWNDVKGLKLDEKNLSRSWWRPMSKTWKQDVCGAAQKNKGLLHQAVRERKQGTYSDRPVAGSSRFWVEVVALGMFKVLVRNTPKMSHLVGVFHTLFTFRPTWDYFMILCNVLLRLARIFRYGIYIRILGNCWIV